MNHMYRAAITMDLKTVYSSGTENDENEPLPPPRCVTVSPSADRFEHALQMGFLQLNTHTTAQESVCPDLSVIVQKTLLM